MKFILFRVLIWTIIWSAYVNTSSADLLKVDLEIVLAVDTSSSMDLDEQLLQRDGYIAAFRSKEVIRTILSGRFKSIAVTYVEWAGEAHHRIIIPWMLIDSEVAALEFAKLLSGHTPLRSNRTSISQALYFARDQLLNNGFFGDRLIVDISGDGPNNQGAPVDQARNHLVQTGITINGLPILAKPTYIGFGIDHLDEFYRKCVIGGIGSFMIPVYDWNEFGDAIHRKLVLELSSITPTTIGNTQMFHLASVSKPETYDCQKGEKTWKQFHGDWKLHQMPPPD